MKNRFSELLATSRTGIVRELLESIWAVREWSLQLRPASNTPSPASQRVVQPPRRLVCLMVDDSCLMIDDLRRRTTKASQGSMESTRSITAYERFMNMVKLWIEKSYKGVDQVSRYLRWKRPKTKSLCFARASGLTQAARIYKNVLKRGTKALQNRTHPGTQKWSQNDANMDPKTSQNGAGPMGYPPPSGRLRRTPDGPHFFEVF